MAPGVRPENRGTQRQAPAGRGGLGRARPCPRPHGVRERGRRLRGAPGCAARSARSPPCRCGHANCAGGLPRSQRQGAFEFPAKKITDPAAARSVAAAVCGLPPMSFRGLSCPRSTFATYRLVFSAGPGSCPRSTRTRKAARRSEGAGQAPDGCPGPRGFWSGAREGRAGPRQSRLSHFERHVLNGHAASATDRAFAGSVTVRFTRNAECRPRPRMRPPRLTTRRVTCPAWPHSPEPPAPLVMLPHAASEQARATQPALP